MLISILCPTRGRPDNIEKLVKSAYRTAYSPREVEFVFYIDEDDTPSLEKVSSLIWDKELDEGWEGLHVFKGGRIVLSQMWNKCYELSRGEILMHAGDDIIFRTVGWDKIVRDMFMQVHDRVAFVYGSDGLQPETFGTHGFLSREAIEAVGYFMPPYFSSDYNDTWWNDVYGMIGRKYHMAFMTEHMHYTAGKAEIDQNTIDRLERHAKDKVWEIYNNTYNERVADAAKLQKVIDEYKAKNNKA